MTVGVNLVHTHTDEVKADSALCSYPSFSLPDAVSFCTLNCSHEKKGAQNISIFAIDFLGQYLSLPNLQLSFQSAAVVIKISINPMQEKKG